MIAPDVRLRGAAYPHRWLAMGAMLLALLAIGVDVTVLSLALPTLADSLHASEAQLQWFMTAYTLALAAFMIPMGVLGDRFGRKTLLVGGLVLFGAASVACAFSPSPEFFIAARVALGIAGAALTVMSLSVVMVLFAPEERPRAIGAWAAANFLAMPLGPIVGGWVLTHAWWGWVFLMNVPLILLGLAAVLALVPQSRSERRPRLDLVGVALASSGLALVMYGLTQAGENGWGDAGAIGGSVGGAAALAGLVAWEAWYGRRPGSEPLIDLALFRLRTFSCGLALTAAGIFGMYGVLFTLPQYLQAIAGIDAQGSGLRFLPVIAGMALGAIPADRIASRIGPRYTVAAGFVVIVAGLALGSGMAPGSGDAFIVGWTFLVGFGSGVGLSTAASVAVMELSAERSGVGSALVQAITKLGPAFGSTILGSVLNATYHAEVAVGGLPGPLAAAAQKSVFGGLAVAGQIGSSELADSVRRAFVDGMNDATRTAAAIAVVAGVAGLVWLPRRMAARAGATPPAAGETSTPAPAAEGAAL